MFESDIFRITIPLTEQVKYKDAILSFCKTPRKAKEIMEHIGLKQREHFRSEVLTPLLEQKQLFMTNPDSPNAPNQKYYSNAGKKQ